MQPRISRLLPLVIWAIALIYLSAIDLKGLWTDEGYRLLLMNGGQPVDFTAPGTYASPRAIIGAVRPTNYEPLYFLLQSAVMRVTHSRSEIILRLVNILILIVAIHGLLRLIKDWLPSSKLFAVVLFSLNGYLMMEVLQVREYILFVALVVWTTTCFFELFDADDFSARRCWMWLVTYSLLIAVGFYSHIWTVPFVLCQAFVAVFRRRNRRPFLVALGAAYAGAAMAVLPWIVSAYLRYASKIEPTVIDSRRPTLGLFLDAVSQGWLALMAYRVDAGYVLLNVYAVVLVATVCAVLITMNRRDGRDYVHGMYAILCMTPFLLFQTLYFFLKHPLSMWPRYFVVYYFSFSYLGAYAFELLSKQYQAKRAVWLRYAIAAFFCVVLVSGAAQVFRYRSKPFMDTTLSWDCDWRRIAREIARYVRSGDTVIFYHPLQAWTMATSWPLETRSAVFTDVLSGAYTRQRALWVFDTGVDQELLQRTLARLDTDRYQIKQSDDLSCRCRLMLMERNLTAGSMEAAAKELEGNARLRLDDLSTVKRALEKYYEANRSYPKSSGGFDGLYTKYGVATSQWIPGLVPRYLGSLPRDPRHDADGNHQFLYWSDGKDYKLIAHATEDCALVKQVAPMIIDPMRDCWAYGYWTPGAAER